MMKHFMHLVILLVFDFLSENKVYSIGDDASCVSYGPGVGSHVYPLDSKSEGHQLQYTKAVSKYRKISTFQSSQLTVNLLKFEQ